MQSKSSDSAIDWDLTPKMQFSSLPVPSASSFGIYSEEITPSNSADSSAFFCNILNSNSPLSQQKNSWSTSDLWRMQRSAIGGVLDQESTHVGGQPATGDSIVSTCSQGFSQTPVPAVLLETSQYNSVSFSSFLKLCADHPTDCHHNAGKDTEEGKCIGPDSLDAARLYDLIPPSSTTVVPISLDQLSQDIFSSSEHMQVSNSQAPEDIHAMITSDCNSFPLMSPPVTQALADVHRAKTIDFGFESNFYSHALNSHELHAFEAAPKSLLSQFRSRKPVTYPFGDEEENGICPGNLLPQTKSAISAKVECLDHNSKDEQCLMMNLGNTNTNTNVYPHKRNSTEAVLGEKHQPPRKSAVLWSSANGYNNVQNSSVVTYNTSISAPKTATRLALNTRQRSKHGNASDPQSIAARHRRERISERLKILQDLVPNGSKVDLVTMLEKAINYVKFLQMQVQVLTTDEYWPKHDMVPTIMRVEDALQAIASAEANRKAFSATNIDSTSWKNSVENPLTSCEKV